MRHVPIGQSLREFRNPTFTQDGLAAVAGDTSAVFSPDSKRVLTAGSDGKVRIWDAATGRTFETLAASTASVLSAVFSPDQGRKPGRRRLVGSSGKTMQEYSGRPLADDAVRSGVSVDLDVAANLESSSVGSRAHLDGSAAEGATRRVARRGRTAWDSSRWA